MAVQHWGQPVDNRLAPQSPDLVAKAIVPDYALGNHTASLGLTFTGGAPLPEAERNGAFMGNTGRGIASPAAGYKVSLCRSPTASVRTALGCSHGLPQRAGEALGRPVGVAIDPTGRLLVADDVGNTWRVGAASAKAAMGN